MQRSLRQGVGLLACFSAVLALLGWSQREPAAVRLMANLWTHATAVRPVLRLRSQKPMLLAVGDPVFVRREEEHFRQVGEVVSVGRPSADRGPVVSHSAVVLLYADAPRLTSTSQMRIHHTPDSLDWVISTLLPPSKRLEVANELKTAFDQHQAEILAAFRPIVEDGLREAAGVVEEELAASLDRHRAEIDRLGDKYQREFVDEELTALFRDEILPIVRNHAEPVAKEVGMEIWQRVSLWRFAWRYAYDKTPLLGNDLVNAEWERFVSEEAMPVLEDHAPQFVALQQSILSDVARNERVRESLRKNALQITDDPEVRAIVGAILREVLVDNPRLKDVFDKHWRGPRAQSAMALASRRVEPVVRRIGDLLIGTREDGVTPEFAAVLRNQILLKDRRWLVLETGGSADARTEETSGIRSGEASPTARELPVVAGDPSDANPFLSQLADDAVLRISNEP